MSKELWIAEMERRMAELDEDCDTACERAHTSYIDRLADHADYLRKAAREDAALMKVGTPASETTAPKSE